MSNEHRPSGEKTGIQQPTQAMDTDLINQTAESKPQDGPHVTLPSVADLKKKVESGEAPPLSSTGPQYVPGHIDAGAFLRAQHAFIEVQTWFFSNSHNGHYEGALLTYSKAQTAYISALSEIVKSLGVV